jgi:LacI family transcriptional regulator
VLSRNNPVAPETPASYTSNGLARTSVCRRHRAAPHSHQPAELSKIASPIHLLDRGARKLVFLAGCPDLRLIRRRLAGVERAVAGAGASLEVVDAPDLTISAGREAGRQVLLSQSVDGVVCPSDLLAVGVIQAATDLGIRVPDDLIVVGYDDNHFASESSIPVSTVRLPGYRMGELAIELLLEEIRQGSDHVHRTVMLDPHLIPRRSTLRPHENSL